MRYKSLHKSSNGLLHQLEEESTCVLLSPLFAWSAKNELENYHAGQLPRCKSAIHMISKVKKLESYRNLPSVICLSVGLLQSAAGACGGAAAAFSTAVCQTTPILLKRVQTLTGRL